MRALAGRVGLACSALCCYAIDLLDMHLVLGWCSECVECEGRYGGSKDILDIPDDPFCTFDELFHSMEVAGLALCIRGFLMAHARIPLDFVCVLRVDSGVALTRALCVLLFSERSEDVGGGTAVSERMTGRARVVGDALHGRDAGVGREGFARSCQLDGQGGCAAYGPGFRWIRSGCR